MHLFFVTCCYLSLLHPFILTFGQSVSLDLLLHESVFAFSKVASQPIYGFLKHLFNLQKALLPLKQGAVYSHLFEAMDL